eukprot:g3117.t1
MISKSEIRYVKEGVELNCRSDGRDRLSFRSNLTLYADNKKSFLPQCHGSSKVTLDAFSVECGVKCTIGKDEPASRIVCDVQLAGNDEDREEEERHHTDVMNAMYEAALKDESMKIVPEHGFSWVVYADVVVFGRTERLTSDLTSLAIVAALKNARFPKIEVTNAEEDEFDIDHAAPQQRLPDSFLNTVPLCVTLARIGSHFVVDATSHEMKCSDLDLTVAVNGVGNICSVRKGGVQGCISPDALISALKTAHIVATNLLRKTDESLSLSTKKGSSVLSL